jgi:hypothetical protein
MVNVKQNELVIAQNDKKTTDKKNGQNTELEKITEELKKSKQNILRLEMELSQVRLQAKNLIGELLRDCPMCGNKMLTLDWNSKVYTLTCFNHNCTSYRKPLKNISKEIIEGFTWRNSEEGNSND